MSPGNGFAVDVPVTNLDEDIDDFRIQTEEQEHDFNRQIDIADLNFGASNPNANIFTRSANAMRSLFFKQGFSELNNSNIHSDFNIDEIELANTEFGDNGLNENSNDLDFSYYKNPSAASKILRMVYAVITSKLLIYPVLLTAGSLLLIYIVVVSKNASSSQGPFDPMGDEKPKEGPIMKPMTNLLTVVLAVEGLHSHFISDLNMPFLANLINSTNAVFAPYIKDANPSSKVPSLWALSTGKYPAHNGIIGDEFYDIELDSSFTNTDMDSKWWLSEPIWETVSKNNKHATAFNWPMVRISETNPVDNDDGFHVRFEYREQLIKINKYLSGSDAINNEINLLLSSVNTLNSKIRKYGLGSELTESLHDLDDFIAEFYDLMKTLHLEDIANIIITSDGNTAPVTKERIILLDSLVDISKIQHIEGKPIVGIYPTSEFSVDETYRQMKEKWAEHPLKRFFQIHKSEEIAKRIYGGESNRIAPIMIIPSAGYLVLSDSTLSEKDIFYVPGYGNNEMLSRGVFIATGPYFEQNSVPSRILKPFDIIQIYNMLCHSLDIQPVENDGDANFLKNSDNYINENWNDGLKYPGVEFEMPYIKEKSVIEYRFTPPEPTSLVPIELIPEDPNFVEEQQNGEGQEEQDNEKETATQQTEELEDTKNPEESKPEEHITSPNEMNSSDEDRTDSKLKSKLEHWWSTIKETVEDIFNKEDEKENI